MVNFGSAHRIWKNFFRLSALHGRGAELCERLTGKIWKKWKGATICAKKQHKNDFWDKYIPKNDNKTEVKEIMDCPKCDGKIVERKTKRGKIFYGCNNYPKCDFASWDKPLPEKCPNCQSYLVEKKDEVKCSNCEYEKNK